MSDHGSTRRQLLASGAAAGAGTLIVPGLAAAATIASSPTDADRIRRLLSVELLVLYCYDEILSTPVLKPRARRILAPLHAHEEAHIHALEAELTRLGGTPPAAPASITQANQDLARRSVGGRLGQLQGSRDALFLLLALEQVVIGAYFVALAKLADKRLITLAAEIMASEAQHEALVGVALHPGKLQDAAPYGLVQGLQ